VTLVGKTSEIIEGTDKANDFERQLLDQRKAPVELGDTIQKELTRETLQKGLTRDSKQTEVTSQLQMLSGSGPVPEDLYDSKFINGLARDTKEVFVRLAKLELRVNQCVSELTSLSKQASWFVPQDAQALPHTALSLAKGLTGSEGTGTSNLGWWEDPLDATSHSTTEQGSKSRSKPALSDSSLCSIDMPYPHVNLMPACVGRRMKESRVSSC